MAEPPAGSNEPTVGVVVLTQGRRPADLARAVASVLDQQGVATEVVVVGNGWDPREAESPLPAGLATLHLPVNLGIPAGRNAGVPLVRGEYVFFLDDDARLADRDFLAQAVARVRADPMIGLLQPRVLDPEGHPAPKRWTPRMGNGDPLRSGAVFSCWEGAVLLPRAVFDRTGGWAAPFFYAHEGIELAWRVWDQGLIAWYAADLIAYHPAIEPTRHSFYHRLNARNRVWLAKRNLPSFFAPLYVGSWTTVQVLRSARRPRTLRVWFAGWLEGWRIDPGGRRPLRWRTVWRMTRAGRPPIV